MEHGARLSTSRVMAIAFIFMSVLIVLSLSVNVIQGVNNYRLQNEQRTAVTPMAFNAPFAVSQNSADASYLQQMALSFIALRLNVSSETVGNDSNLLIVFYCLRFRLCRSIRCVYRLLITCSFPFRRDSYSGQPSVIHITTSKGDSRLIRRPSVAIVRSPNTCATTVFRRLSYA